jgi:hypothetical protein
MNNYFNYARLAEIADKDVPFRGTNRYPVENRRHTYKYFTIDTDTDGQRMFNIGYYHMHDKETITDEEYKEIVAKTKSKRALNKLHQEDEWDEVNKRYNPTGNHYRYLKNDRILATVRADNTIEFNETYYGQGDRHFLSGDGWTTKGYFSTSVKHGGMTYFLSNTKRKQGLPIFKGMRFNMTTLELHPDSKYIFKRRTVNRKKVKEAFKKYEQPLTLAKTMLSAMTSEVFKDDIGNVLAEYLGDEVAQSNWMGTDCRKKAMEIADSIILDKPLDAIYLYIKSMHIRFYLSDKPIDTFTRVKHQLKKHLYYLNDTFDYDEYDSTHPLPTSSWDMDLIVNGKIIIR